MAYQAKTPGKKGTITDILVNKNIGIDGKTFQLIDERVPMVQKANYQIGDRIEYRVASQGDLTIKGKINFIGPDKDAPTAPKQSAPAQPSEPAAPKTPVREPRIVQGQYMSKTGSSITLKDTKGNAEAWPADLDLIAFLNKADGKVKVGDMVKVRLLDNHGEWIAKNMGPFDPTIPEKPFKTAGEILKENLDTKKADQEKADAALAQINKEETTKPSEVITETEAADLIARGEAAKMQKIQKEAAEHSEKMKAENAARKAASSVESPPETLVKSQPAIKNAIPAIQPEDASTSASDEHMAGPVELGIRLDMGSYSSFELKVSELTADRAIARLEADAMKTISMMRRLMSASKKGY